MVSRLALCKAGTILGTHNMKRIGFLITGLLVAATLVFTTPAKAITLDFAAISGGQVQFVGSGDTFTFLPTSTSQNQFRVTGSDGFGDSVSLYGRMNGSFSIGSITTIGSLQTASVSGSGQ